MLLRFSGLRRPVTPREQKDWTSRCQNQSKSLACPFLSRPYRNSSTFLFAFLDFSSWRTSIHHVDWRFNPCIVRDLQENLDFQERIR